MWTGLTNWLKALRSHGSLKPLPPSAHSSRHHKDVTCLVFEQLCLDAFLDHANTRQTEIAALGEIKRLYRIQRTFPDLSNFRLGPNMFDKIKLDWILLVDESKGSAQSRLLAHGVATRMYWTGAATDLPAGWQGAVRRSYSDANVDNVAPNSLVGLFINVEPSFRERGLAANVVEVMKTIRRDRQLAHLIIPLRLPQHYKREYATMPIAEFGALRRDDGQPVDHWLRLHLRAGAQVLAFCDTSHQHAMNTRDFAEQFGARFDSTGYHLVEKNDEWFRVFIDVDREFALVNQGCAWVEYPSGS